MRAVVLSAPHRLDVVTDWPEPVPGPDDVVVAVHGVGLCGSDLGVYDGARSVPQLPWVMGHEGGGDIVDVGERVRDRSVGQRVVIEPNYPCLTCNACRTGHTSACGTRGVVGMNVPGLLAERVAVPAQFTWPVDAKASGEMLASIEPLAVARAAVRSAAIRDVDRCLVLGAGSQGLLVCMSLIAEGVRPAVTDPHDGRTALAVDLGAVRAGDDETYPFVFETAGVTAAVRSAVERVSPLGTVILIGLDSADLPLTTLDLVRRQLTLRGKLIYDHPSDFADTLRAVDDGLDPSIVIRAGIPPEDAAAAFAQARTVVGKSWIDLASWHADG
jgi:threonine dehydrogenase-like Zn-dependent dehydrogenase